METPEFFQTGDQFIIEDLLDFSNDETMAVDEGGLEVAATGTSTDSTVAATSCNSSFSAGICKAEPHFHQEAAGLGELGLPYDDLAELEWLSNFVEESFSTDEFQKLQLIQGGMKALTTSTESPETHQYQFQPGTAQPGTMFRSEMSVPAKARSKRSRAAPGNWTSRLLVVSPPPSTTSSSSESDVKKAVKQAMPKKKEVLENSGNEGRKCLHCATDKTPQWRTGPMGPKTLCNACGVRYKSGRLVPEYRPAASPTFVLSKHSNSHRKVLELRKQKEMRSGQHQFHHQNYMFDHVNNSGDDYLIHQHIEPDFRQMI